jgi:glutamate-1-semialdehyde 2,1-aminomutase
MPGPHSNLKIPVNIAPNFIVRGQGAHLWDVDGNEYIDFMCGAGPGIFGYYNKEYIHAIKSQLDSIYYLVSGAAQTPMEVELADKFVKHVPCVEKVRFCLSGTDAVQLAIRLARAYTGREYFIRFEGHYHGWWDNVIGGVVNDNSNETPFAVESVNDPLATEGKYRGAFQQSFKIPWNDIEALEKVLRKYGTDVAMVIMEPIMCNTGCCPPRPGYLEKVRELCTQYGTVLCFDEVITGFRVGLNCAQGILGVTPDIATFGKGMAGGIPISAVGGKKEIMDLLLDRRVIGAGTFNGYPLGVAASLVTLNLLERDNGAYYQRIDRIQGQLVSGLTEISKRRGLPVLIQGPRGIFYYQFIERDIAYSVRDLKEIDAEKQNRFRVLMAEEGVFIMWGGRWYLCDALTQSDIEKTLESVDRVLGRL